MSVTKDKTLATVRTFAQDFREHAPEGTAPAVKPAPEDKKSEEKKGPIITVVKGGKQKSVPTPKVTVPKIVVPKKADSEKIIATPVIPAFHEIEKSVKTKTSQKPTIVVQKKSPKKHLGPGDFDATIITATKKAPKKRSGESLLSQLTTWLKNLFTTQKKQTATYQVPDSTRRKGVIQKATTKSGTIFTADNETLREDIIKRREKEAEESHVSWSPNVNTGYSLLEAPTIQVPENLPAVEPSPAQEIEESRWNPPISNSIPEKPTPAPEQVLEAKPAPVEPAPVLPTPVSIAQEFTPPTQPKAEPFQALRILFAGARGEVATNSLALGVVAVVAATFIAIVSVQAITNLFAPTEVFTPEQTISPLLVEGSVLDVVVLSGDLASTLSQADTLTTAATQELRLVNLDQTPLNGQEVVSEGNWGLESNFRQSISTVRFAVIDSVQHAILISTEDTLTALGGMLQWETNMYSDLDTVLNLQSLPGESVRFIDDTYGASDVRILTDGTEEVLVWGFVKDNIILITKTSETFKRLAP